ncbi:MAG: hypothetical protein H0X11_09995 [Betaproteobacteria bacterium]|nr:hypothetical protein [Betaproteobacteria bacterium]
MLKSGKRRFATSEILRNAAGEIVRSARGLRKEKARLMFLARAAAAEPIDLKFLHSYARSWAAFHRTAQRAAA